MIKIYEFLSDISFRIARRFFIIGDFFEVKADHHRWRLISQDELEHIEAMAQEIYADIEREVAAQEPHPKAPHLPS